MTEAEAAVIEAAMEWANTEYGRQFGPMPPSAIKQAYSTLYDACSYLAAECEGQWKRSNWEEIEIQQLREAIRSLWKATTWGVGKAAFFEFHKSALLRAGITNIGD